MQAQILNLSSLSKIVQQIRKNVITAYQHIIYCFKTKIIQQTWQRLCDLSINKSQTHQTDIYINNRTSYAVNLNTSIIHNFVKQYISRSNIYLLIFNCKLSNQHTLWAQTFGWQLVWKTTTTISYSILRFILPITHTTTHIVLSTTESTLMP